MKSNSIRHSTILLRTAFFIGAVVVMLSAFSSLASKADASTDAENFVRQANMAGLFEIKSSKIALRRTQDDDIKQFAQTMIDDHGKMSKELEATLPKTSVDPDGIAKDLDPDHQRILDSLTATPDSTFDRNYVKDQRNGHAEAVKLFQDYAANGSDAVLKAFAERNLPTLQQHEDMAMKLRIGVTKVGKFSH